MTAKKKRLKSVPKDTSELLIYLSPVSFGDSGLSADVYRDEEDLIKQIKEADAYISSKGKFFRVGSLVEVDIKVDIDIKD